MESNIRKQEVGKRKQDEIIKIQDGIIHRLKTEKNISKSLWEQIRILNETIKTQECMIKIQEELSEEKDVYIKKLEAGIKKLEAGIKKPRRFIF
jgi:hypothetical protein